MDNSEFDDDDILERAPRRRRTRTEPTPIDVEEEIPSDREFDELWGLVEAEPITGSGAPHVVAVLVAKDPGDWFDEVLESLRQQDYEQMSVLVIDNASEEDQTARIADYLPGAFVKRLDQEVGFSAAANEALQAVEGAPFLLFLHDDVALEVDTVTRLVSEAFRSTAGIVGPKLLNWDSPHILESVGYAVDPYGFSSSIAEAGEIDQSQHDVVREVFAVSSACMLIRADLFETIDGFREEFPFFGEDIDLCWRARLAGARVYITPRAQARHRNNFKERRPNINHSRLALRHEARTMLSNYEPFQLLRVLPMVVLLSTLDFLASVVIGRFQRAGDIVHTWVWNIIHIPSLLGARSRIKKTRRVHASEYLPLMRQGSTRLSALFKDEERKRLESATGFGREFLRENTTGANGWGVAIALSTAVLLVLGTRGLFFENFPAIRDFVGVQDRGPDLLREWFSGWRTAGFGESGISPNITLIVGALGTVMFGKVHHIWHLIVLLPLFIGALGAWKFITQGHSLRARAVMMAMYSLNPIVLNALASGRLSTLWLFALLPWLARRVLRLTRVGPFSQAVQTDTYAVDAQAQQPLQLRSIAGTALMLALVVAVNPLAGIVGVATVIVLVLGVASTVSMRVAGQVIAHTVLAFGAALITNIGWIFAALKHGDLTALTGITHTGADALSFHDLMTGATGPLNPGNLTWGLYIAAAAVLFLGESWRFRLGLAAWPVVLLSGVIAAVLAQAGLVGGVGPELFLIPVVLGLAFAGMLSVMSFEHDVIGSDFGLRQVVSLVALVTVVVGLVPSIGAATDGRWRLPDGGFDRFTSLLDNEATGRMLWIGDGDALPGRGWVIDEDSGLSALVSEDVATDLTDSYRIGVGAGATELTSVLQTALNGEISRIGALLESFGISHIVIVNDVAPPPYGDDAFQQPEALANIFRDQLDLHKVDLNPGMLVFRVDEPWPRLGMVSPESAEQLHNATIEDVIPQNIPTPTASNVAVTGHRAHGSFMSDADTVPVHNTEADPGWKFTTTTGSISPETGLGWMQVFTGADVEDTDSDLRFHAPLTDRGFQAVSIVTLLGLLIIVLYRSDSLARLKPTGQSEDEQPLVVVDPSGEELS